MKNTPSLSPDKLEISFLHLDPSAAVEDRIRTEVATLLERCPRIHSCRVVVGSPHHHRQHGREVCVKIDLGVPGSHIVINHEPALHGVITQGSAASVSKDLETQPDHKDIYVSVRDAFAAARHRLETYKSNLAARGQERQPSEMAEV